MSITTSTWLKDNVVRFTITYKVGGVATDPDTIAFRFKYTTGATTTYSYPTNPELVKDSTGVFHVDVNLNKTGTWYTVFDAVKGANRTVTQETTEVLTPTV